MRLRQISVVFALSVALCAQTKSKPGTAVQDATAITVITQSLSTMGLVASANVRTLSQGTLTDRDGQVNPIAMETAGVDRVRHDVGPDFRFVSNAGTGFLVLQGTRHSLPAWVTEYKRPEHLPSLSLMADYLNPNLQIQYVGLENVNGLPAHHLRFSMMPIDATQAQIEDLISEFHVYIDQASLLVVRTRSFNFSPETLVNRSAVDMYFGDYRQQDGALVPFHLVRYVAGNKDSDIVFTSVSLKANIPDSDFQ
jgi:hypothetical protein